MYVLIVVFAQITGDHGVPSGGFSQEFTTKESCYFAMSQVWESLGKLNISQSGIVMNCVSKDEAKF